MNNLKEFKDYLIFNGYRNNTYISLIKKFNEKVNSIYNDNLNNNDYSNQSNNIKGISLINRDIPFKGDISYINKDISLKRNILYNRSISLRDTSYINEVSIRNFILKQKAKNAVETVNCYLKALKVYLKYLKLDIELPKLYKTPTKNPDFLTLDYLEKEIIPTIKTLFLKNRLKYETILYFDFFTGIRKGEHYNLKRRDFDLKNQLVKIYAEKTMKERILPLNDRITKMLTNYFNSEIEEKNAFNLGAGGVDYLYNTLKPNFDEVNLRSDLMRHSFATHCLTKEMNIKDVKDLLGHENIQSTMKYLGNVNTNLWDKFRRKIK